jgi:hypothetical protein
VDVVQLREALDRTLSRQRVGGKEVKVLSDTGEILVVQAVEFDKENDCVFLKCEYDE